MTLSEEMLREINLNESKTLFHGFLTHVKLETLKSRRAIRGLILLCNSRHLCHFKMLSPAGYLKDSNLLFVSYDYANRSLTFFCQEDDDVSERFEAATLLVDTEKLYSCCSIITLFYTKRKERS